MKTEILEALASHFKQKASCAERAAVLSQAVPDRLISQAECNVYLECANHLLTAIYEIQKGEK
jgi:hypothetical protein